MNTQKLKRSTENVSKETAVNQFAQRWLGNEKAVEAYMLAKVALRRLRRTA